MTSGDHRDYLSRQLASMAPHRAILRAVECRFMSQVRLERPVLDVGCGDGHFASIAYDAPIDVGLDMMRGDLWEARSRSCVYQSLVAGSATALPFGDGAFGTVVSNCVLEHIEDVDTALREIARVLRPGGAFATTLPSEHFGSFLLGSSVLRKARMEGPAKRYEEFFNRISYHYHVYPPSVWRQKLEGVGLRVLRQDYYFSAAAHRAFDLSHYLSIPNLITKRLLGRWVVHPVQSVLFERWLRRYYEEPLPEVGAYQFVQCEKA